MSRSTLTLSLCTLLSTGFASTATADSDEPQTTRTSAPAKQLDIDPMLNDALEIPAAPSAAPATPTAPNMDPHPKRVANPMLATGEDSILEPGEGGLAAPGGSGDVLVDGDYPLWGELELVRHHDSDTLWTVVQTDEGFIPYRSTDDGQFWAQRTGWTTSGGYESIAAAATDDFIYVAYLHVNTPDHIRLRRYFASTGGYDSDYGLHVIDLNEELDEVSLTSNADTIGSHIYLFVKHASGEVSYFWDNSADGETFVEIETGVTDADGGLDSVYTQGDNFIWFSYISDADTVKVGRRSTPDGWQISTLDDTAPGWVARTAICAFEDSTLVAYRGEDPSTLQYRISYSNGDSTWYSLTIYNGSAGNVSNFDVCLRGGYGPAIAYQVEMGEPDDVRFTRRRGYEPGTWSAHSAINDHDTLTGFEVRLVNMAPSFPVGSKFDFGLAYSESPQVWFDRMSNCPADVNGDGQVDVNDLLVVMAEWGVCGGCDGDITEDGFVDVDDMIYLLGEWGACD